MILIWELIVGKRIDGFKAAVEMLQGLNLSEQQALIAEMARKDPEMAVKLKAAIITFDDLIKLTPTMMSDFLRVISTQTLGLALRGASLELQNHLTKMVSRNIREDIDFVLKGKPQALSEVMKAQDEIMQKVRELIDQGKVVLSGNDELV